MRPQDFSTLFVFTQRKSSRFSPLIAVVVVTLALCPFARGQQDIGARIEQARGKFKPVSAEQVAAARAEAQTAMRSVEQFVGPSTQNGKRWLRYLKWDDLKQQLSDKNPQNVDASDATLEKLNRNIAGLERRQFRNLARSLRRYRDKLALSLLEKPAEIYDQQLGALQQSLDAYRKEPSPKNEFALSETLQILDSIGQSPELVRAVRAEMARPNAFVDVTTSLIAAGIDPVSRSEFVPDCILGVNIKSDTTTHGSAGVTTIPNDNKAVLEFNSRGHTFARNVGHKSPAVIHSTADTNYTATKRVELSDETFASLPAQASAHTDTHIHSVAKQGGGLGSRLVSRIGWNRARESEGRAEAIAADHAESRIEGHFNDEVNEQVRKMRKQYEEEFRRPLERRGDVPEHIRFSTGKDWLAVEATQANRSQLAAPGAPPSAGEAHDVTMRLHESAINNYTASLLGGATATQTRPDEDIKFNVELPDWMDRIWKNRKTQGTADAGAQNEPFKPYSMTLRDGRPISVRFVEGKVHLTLHIADLKSGDKSFTDWDVTGVYNPELANGGVKLTREGKLEMLPADFEGRLDSQQVAERSNLEKELEARSAQGKGFPMSIQFDPVQPEGKLAKAGPLDYRQFRSGDGWLVIGLDRQTKQNSQAATKTASTVRSNGPHFPN